MMDAAEILIRDKTLKTWRFLYARGFIEGFGHVSCALGKPVWLDDQIAADAAAELLKTRGPFRRIWALVESDTED